MGEDGSDNESQEKRLVRFKVENIFLDYKLLKAQKKSLGK